MTSLSTQTGSAMPHVDFVAHARITRKTLERLASFSQLRSLEAETLLLTKLLDRVHAFIKLIDSSIVTARVGHHIATTAIMICDPENKEWEIVLVDSIRELSSKGSEMAREIATGFADIDQVLYKTAASTKDNMLLIETPTDPTTHTEKIKMHLKDVGADLVANLSLFTQFSRSMNGVADWWDWIKNDLASENPTLLPPLLSESDSETQEAGNLYAIWTMLKKNLQEYHNIINAIQLRFPDLLSLSIVAWKSDTFSLSSLSSGTAENLENKTEDPAARKRSKLEALSNYISIAKRTISNAKHSKRDASERRFLVKRRSTSGKRKIDANSTAVTPDQSVGKTLTPSGSPSSLASPMSAQSNTTSSRHGDRQLKNRLFPWNWISSGNFLH